MKVSCGIISKAEKYKSFCVREPSKQQQKHWQGFSFISYFPLHAGLVSFYFHNKSHMPNWPQLPWQQSHRPWSCFTIPPLVRCRVACLILLRNIIQYHRHHRGHHGLFINKIREVCNEFITKLMGFVRCLSSQHPARSTCALQLSPENYHFNYHR